MSIVKKCLKLKSRMPRLSVKGIIVHCVNAANRLEQRFDWADALIDAVIVSGLSFFSTLGGGSIAGLSGIAGLKAATIAACAQFFIFLALKRGIVQAKEVSV